ncbi:ABSCISIC ACID-INSENSITIVE protein [Trifolium repens]|nr:ABSCISIC ACID-INSENSITIVE protein [Trifolium repens]
MNLDELLKNVISAESDQLMQNPSSSNSNSNNNNNNSFFIGSTSGNNLNETLSDKAFNGIWSEINHQKHAIGGSMDHNNLQQSILGETAFEDFLTHAKAFNIGNQDNVHVIGDANQVPFIGIESKLVMASQPEHWLPFQMPIPIQMQQHQEHQNRPIIGICQDFNVAKPVYENQIMDIGYSENSLAMSMPIGATTMSFPLNCSDSKGVVAGAATDGRVGVGRKHKYSDEMMEKTIERRQKRMAKNRESAARSRAKKQVIKTPNA